MTARSVSMTIGKKKAFRAQKKGMDTLSSTKSKKRADEIIKEMEDILPKLDNSWNEYVEYYVEFENKRRVLDTYVRRGVINRDSIPKAKKRKLIDALYEYRAKRKKNG